MKNKMLEKKIRRARRSRAQISGTGSRPRMSVFRSNKHFSVQLIDDDKGITLVHASTMELKGKKGSKIEQAKEVGSLLAKKSVDAKIKEALFDRRSYKYHGRVKAVAEGAREGGLKI